MRNSLKPSERKLLQRSKRTPHYCLTLCEQPLHRLSPKRALILLSSISRSLRRTRQSLQGRQQHPALLLEHLLGLWRRSLMPPRKGTQSHPPVEGRRRENVSFFGYYVSSQSINSRCLQVRQWRQAECSNLVGMSPLCLQVPFSICAHLDSLFENICTRTGGQPPIDSFPWMKDLTTM